MQNLSYKNLSNTSFGQFCWSLVLVWPIIVTAQPVLKTTRLAPATSDSRPFVFFETIGKNEGLPSGMHSIGQDSSGYIWLLGESGQGAVKFDGAKFVPVPDTPDDLRALPAQTVHALLPYPDGNIWLATDRGMYFWDANTGYFYEKSCNFTREFLSILQDRKGEIYAGSKEGLAMYDAAKDCFVPFPKGIVNGYTGTVQSDAYFDAFPQLFEHPDGTIWSVAVLYRASQPNLQAVIAIDPDRKTLRYFPLPPTQKAWAIDLNAWSQLDLANRCIWIPQETALLKFSLTDFSFEKFTLGGLGGRTPFLTRVKTADKGRVWVASSDGLFMVDLVAGQYHTFEPPRKDERASLNGNRCRDILVSSDHTTWCLFEDYLAKIDPNRQLFPVKPSAKTQMDAEAMVVVQPAQTLLQLHFKPARTLAIKSVHRSGGKNLDKQQKIPGLSIGPAHITKICSLSDGRILVGMNCGLAWLDGATLALRPVLSTIEKMPDGKRIDELWVSDIKEDHAGNIWLSTWNGGMIEFQKKSQRFVNHTLNLGGWGQSLFNQCYLSVLQDSLGRMVFGSNGTGLEIWDPATHAYYRVSGDDAAPAGFQAKFIYCQFKDSKTRHWIGTENGLYRFSAGETLDRAFTRYETGGWVFDILSDSLNRLWLKTTNGLVLFDPETGRKQLFGEEQGMSLAPPYALKVLFLENNHSLWFGSSLNIDPLSIQFATLHVRPALTGLKIHDQPWQNGAPLAGVRHIDLAYNEHTLRFEFTALDFGSSPGKQWYMVKLQPLGAGFAASDRPAEWIDLGNQPYATFANLSAGKYRLFYRCGNQEAGWLPEADALTIDFTIRPHWSRTWWFQLLSAMAVLGVIASILTAYYRFRLRAQQLENEKKQREAERRRLELEKAAITAESMRKAAESEMILLRSQLNPHFLFNAMNSINRYVLSNDSEKAGEYLGKFAMLMRSILENSRSLTIPLADELKMIDGYLALESLRFRQQITWTIDLGPEIDEDVVQVPSMFLQPFAENAVLHGLAPRGGGHIHLAINLLHGALHCSLKDNGVGRQAAGKRAPGINRPAHASVGMRLISERLDAFAALEGRAAEVRTIDHSNADGTAAGTEVQITLPLVESI